MTDDYTTCYDLRVRPLHALFLNTAKYENDKLEAYMKRLSKK